MLENRLHKHKECQGTKYQNQTLHLKKKLLRLQLKTPGGASSMLEKFSSQKIGSYIFCNCTHQVDA